MDSSPGTAIVVEARGVRVETVRGLWAASLRYFDPAGSFAAAVHEAIGQPVAQPLTATQSRTSHDAQVILAWRTPTETLLLCNGGAAFTQFEQRLPAAADGCMVDQTGAFRVFRVQGRRAREVLQRMGATTAIPGLGQARGGRMAEVHVLTVCIEPGEFLLVIERVYADHLTEWIRATLADFN